MDAEGDDVSELRRDADVEPALDDEVERVGGVVTMEDDLAAAIRGAPREGEHGSDVVARDAGEELPFHQRLSQALHTLCHGRERRRSCHLLAVEPWSNGREGGTTCTTTPS